MSGPPFLSPEFKDSYRHSYYEFNGSARQRHEDPDFKPPVSESLNATIAKEFQTERGAIVHREEEAQSLPTTSSGEGEQWASYAVVGFLLLMILLLWLLR